MLIKQDFDLPHIAATLAFELFIALIAKQTERPDVNRFSGKRYFLDVSGMARWTSDIRARLFLISWSVALFFHYSAAILTARRTR